MSDEPTEQTGQPVPDKPRAERGPRTPRLAIVVALLALAGTTAQWFYGMTRMAADSDRAEQFATRLQRRLSALEDRVKRERDDLDRLTRRIGTDRSAEDSLAGRISQLEEAIAQLPGGERVRLFWRVEQAEYFMRVANAQETLAGDSAGALTALSIADEHLRDAADPRLTPVRKLLAKDIAALRAVPRIDTEGVILKLTALASSIAQLTLRQPAPAAFAAPAPAPAAELTGTQRAIAALRNAFSSIVSVRRTDAPPATLLSEESAGVLVRSLELELQVARLALLRGQADLYRASLAYVRQTLERHFDVASAQAAGALALVDELSRDAPPDSLPDLSGALIELLRIKERELQP